MDFAQQRTRGVLTDLRWAAVRRAKRRQSAEPNLLQYLGKEKSAAGREAECRGVLTDLRWAAVHRAKRRQSAELSFKQIKNPEPMARGFRIHVLLLLQQIIGRHPSALAS